MQTQIVLSLGYSLMFYIGVMIVLSMGLGFCIGEMFAGRKQDDNRKLYHLRKGFCKKGATKNVFSEMPGGMESETERKNAGKTEEGERFSTDTR